ncbi:MAG TPA: hypothetical protein VJG48_01580 [Candidatus Paceibacterota bacterium]
MDYIFLLVVCAVWTVAGVLARGYETRKTGYPVPKKLVPIVTGLFVILGPVGFLLPTLQKLINKLWSVKKQSRTTLKARRPFIRRPEL